MSLTFLNEGLSKIRWLEKGSFPHTNKFGAKFETIGNIEVFSPKLQRRIAMVKEETKHYTNVTQIMALNYGSREEIVRAVSRLNRKGEPELHRSL